MTPVDLLHKSASIRGEHAMEAVPTSVNYVDTYLTMVLTSAGPRFVSPRDLGSTIIVRRVGNLYYDRSFAQLFAKELILSQGRLQPALIRCIVHAEEGGNLATSIMPLHGKSMWCVAADIFGSPHMQGRMAGLLTSLHNRGELQCIALDGHVKVCLAIMGQLRPSEAAKRPSSAAYPDRNHMRKILTVRGISGAVLALWPILEEEAECIHDLYTRSVHGALV